jgi:hypothetical protein
VVLRSASLTPERIARFLELPAMADVEDFLGHSRALDDSLFEVLAKMPKLSKIDIQGGSPGITGRNLGLLKSLKSLTILQCENFTPEGIVELQTLPDLGYVNLDSSRCTAQHVAELSKLKVSFLNTHMSEIDDSCAKLLSQMSMLESLGLLRCELTDVGLLELKSSQKLKYINLRGTKVTAAGVADFQKALPACKIEWDGGQ